MKAGTHYQDKMLNNMASLKLNTIAESLSEVRSKIAEIKQGELLELEGQEETLREALVKELKSKGMKSVNSTLTGELYTRSERFTFKVANESMAFDYARKHDALKVDTSAVAKLLRTPDAPMPEDVGFVADVTEYLSIRKQNGKDTPEN